MGIEHIALEYGAAWIHSEEKFDVSSVKHERKRADNHLRKVVE